MPDLKDTFFRPTTVATSYVAKLQRGAVLRPLAADRLGKHGSAAAIKSATLHVSRLWRDRIAALQEHGDVLTHGRRDPEARLQFLRNCLPAFSGVRPTTTPCTAAKICPFCYAREVGELWGRFVRAMPGRQFQEDEAQDLGELRGITLDETPQKSAEYHLIERRNVRRIPYHVQTLSEVGLTLAFVTQVLQSVSTARAAMLKRVRPYGAYCAVTVEPETHGWRIKSRQLFLVRKNDNIENLLDPVTRGMCYRHVYPTRDILLRALTATCLYPRRLMDGDPLLTSIILKASAGVRLSSTAGALRSNKD
jgi:hypothetical protein